MDVRHREIKDGKNDPKKAMLHTVDYDASQGKEYFLTFEDPKDRVIFSLLRLRLPKNNKNILNVLPELQWCALIREIHTFWDQLNINEKGSHFWQHIGLGKKLIAEAEAIAKNEGYSKMAVIAGVGVRGYYEKRGYVLEGEYMVKYL